MKKVFKTFVGEAMVIDFGDYSVEFYKSIDGCPNCITYIDEKNNLKAYTPFCFIIDWDKDEDGGRIQFNQRDRWGSEMIFIHYAPSDLKGMFDFIAKGYNIKI